MNTYPIPASIAYIARRDELDALMTDAQAEALDNFEHGDGIAEGLLPTLFDGFLVVPVESGGVAVVEEDGTIRGDEIAIRGTDGHLRAWSSVFAGPSSHSHGLNTITGFVVRRTFPGSTRSHEDVAHFDGATSYGDALLKAREIRNGRTSWAVIDTFYSCGCRTNG